MRIKLNTLFLLLLANVILIKNITGQPSQNYAGQRSVERTGSIAGTVIDSKTAQPVEYANIVLYRSEDKSLVTGTISNEKGVFKLEGIPFGQYDAHISFIGYETSILNQLAITGQNPEIDLGYVKINVASENISAVVVTHEREMLQYDIDKRVVHVDRNMASDGGTAVDVLREIPSISVDIDDNVSLRGSRNVTILIDGRPAGIMSIDQIPANMIDRVEIITNPSARYDPEGTSGIINVILKRQKTPGYNGLVNLNAGTGDKYIGGVNLNYRQNKLNVFASYNYRHFNRAGTSILNRESFLLDTTRYLEQVGEFHPSMTFQNINGGVDYYINDKNTLTASFRFNNRDFGSNEHMQYWNSNDRIGLTDYFTRATNSERGGGGNQYTINYNKKFNTENHQLNADVFYTTFNFDNIQHMSQQFFNTDNLSPIDISPELQNTYNISNNNILTMQADYERPAGQNGSKLETGFRTVVRTTGMDYRFENFNYYNNNWEENEALTNIFNYKEQTHAMYATYSNRFKKIQYQVGARLEHTLIETNQESTDERHNSDYLSFFPTIHLKYELNPVNSFMLSYSRRINRPGLWYINPFVNYSDPLNTSAGNPYLDPEFTNSYEVSHYFKRNKTTLNSSLFLRQTDNMIARNTVLRDNGVTHTTFENLNNGRSYGTEIILTHDIFRWWKVNSSYSYFRTEIEGENLVEEASESNSWIARVNSNFTVWKNMDIQLAFNYNSPIIAAGGSGRGFFMSGGGQGIMREVYYADLGIRKPVMKNKGTISLRLSDVFNTRKFNIETYGYNFTSIMERRNDSRVLYVGFTYRINEYRRERRRDQNNNGMMMDDMD